MCYVPDGWYYAEVDIDGQECILAACSRKCRIVRWNKGPGKLETRESVISAVIDS